MMRHRKGRLALPRLAVLWAGLAAAHSAGAQQWITIDDQLQLGDGAGQGLGRSVARLGDLDGDGVAEYVIGAHRSSFYAGLEAARVCSGATGATMHSVDSITALFVNVAGIGDTDGDAVPDFLVGTPVAGNGTVQLHSGATGAVLFSVSGTSPTDYLGTRVEAMDDITGDGVQEFVAGGCGGCGGGGQDPGLTRVYSGSDGQLVYEIQGPNHSALGVGMTVVPDMDGDGISDVLLGGAGWQSFGALCRVRLCSGVDGSTIWEVTGSTPFGTSFEGAMAAIGDVDGDGLCDFAVGVTYTFFGHDGVKVLSGVDGSVLYSTSLSAGSGATGITGIGRSVCAAGDIDGDGIGDFVAGAYDLSLNRNRVAAFSGVDGSYLSNNFESGAGSVLGLGESIANLGDLTGDGCDELLVGAPEATNSAGEVWLMTTNCVVPSDPWEDLGGATSGINGFPTLEGDGPLTAGSPTTLSLMNTPSNALMLAWIAFTSTPQNELGGTIYATPPANQLFFSADASGTWTATVPWPAGVPSATATYFQFIVQDMSVPEGLTLSNGVRATAP